jgi:diguanylate cyclase (GGDEF)-like protein/PAS domain S-box-containing protein
VTVTLARPDRAFSLIAAAGAVAYITLPRDGALYDRWFQLFPIAAVIAVLIGVTLHQPRTRTPWYLVAVSGMCGIAADAVYAVGSDRLGVVPFPSLSDLLSLVSYAILAVALHLMLRSQLPGRDWPSVIDAGIVTASFAIVSWTFLEPELFTSTSALDNAAAFAFLILDFLLVVFAARMLMGSRLRSPAFTMIGTALVFQLVGDALYGVGSVHGWYEQGDPIDILYVSAAILWGTAALHPSMVALTEPRAESETGLSVRRLAVLSAAALVAPLMLAFGAIRAGTGELLVIVGAAAVLLALVIARLAGLVSRHERGERREQALREAAVALVAAWRREDIYRVAVDSALEIVASGGASVGLAIGSVRDFTIVAAAGERAAVGFGLQPENLPSGAVSELGGASPTSPRAVRIAAAHGEWTLVRLTVQGDFRGAFVIHTHDRLSRVALEGVETLAAQVALALEGTALVADLHERRSSARFRSLVQNSSDIIAVLEDDLTIRYHTPSVERVLGYGEHELVGASLGELLAEGEADKVRDLLAQVHAAPSVPLPADLRLRRKNGSVSQLETVFTNLLGDPNVAGVVVTARDVTERRALEEQLAHQAFHDSLTGLANRLLFRDRVEHALELTRRRNRLVAVLFVDLDDFKTINDSLGHAAGDDLLVAVARRIQACLRPEDTCARLGGDEFGVMVENVLDPDAAIVVARRMLAALSEPLELFGSNVEVEASVGIALGSSSLTTSELLRNADLAMYRAKSEGKSRFALFEPEMHTRVLDRLALKAELQKSVAAGEFELHYQPIVDLQSGGISGVEALVRWRHPKRGLVYPDQFIALAEETGLILPLGRLVLQLACRQATRWRRLGHRELGISVNLSAKQLASRHLSSEVKSALEQARLPASALTLEITESVLMLDSQGVIARLEELKGLGVKIAVDDFGTGYSSLNYLRQFPVDALKVAKPFIDGLGTSSEGERLAAAILRIGATLGLDTVAEGIEERPQHDLLRKLKCDYGQGYLFSRPVPAVAFELLLRRPLVA